MARVYNIFAVASCFYVPVSIFVIARREINCYYDKHDTKIRSVNIQTKILLTGGIRFIG